MTQLKDELQDGLVAHCIHNGRLEILDIVPFTDDIRGEDFEALRKSVQARYPKRQIFIHKAPDQLLQYYADARLPDHVKIAVGKVAIAMSIPNFERAREAIDFAETQQRQVDCKPIDKTCADLGLGTRQLTALEKINVYYVRDLLTKTRVDLLKIPGVAAPSVDGIISAAHEWVEELRLEDPDEYEKFRLQVRAMSSKSPHLFSMPTEFDPKGG